MKRFSARQFLAFAIIVLLASVCCRASDVLSTTDADGGLWLAQVTPDLTAEGKPLASIVRYRGPRDTQWAEVGRINGRATGCAAVGSQLAVLQENGQWLLVWPGESISGTPLPRGTPIKALGSDGQTLWAIGIVTGPLTTQPATTQAIEATPVSVEPRLILFRLDRDQWKPLGPIAVALDCDFAVFGTRGKPFVAARNASGTVRLFEQTRRVDDIVIGDATAFQFLFHEGNTLLWTAGPTGAGEIQRRSKGESPVALKVDSTPPVGVDRALVIAAGRLRLMYLAPDPDLRPNAPLQVYEQKFDLASFQPVGKPEKQTFPFLQPDSTVFTAIQAIAMAGMVIAMVISYQHRRAVRELLEREDRPIPATLLRRAGAGILDLLPMIAATYGAYALGGGDANPVLATELSLAAGTATYLLYTTLMELIVGKTVGKLAFGLKVVSLDGTRPSRSMIARRNLLRVVDLIGPMLLLVVVSPLRQRVGDIASDTMVVLDKPETNEPRTK